MRTIGVAAITAAVAAAARQAACELPADIVAAVRRARRRETAPVARAVLDRILANAACAREQGIPICQDTGLQVVLVEQGRDARVRGDLEAAIARGIAQATRACGLRASSVRDGAGRRPNSGTNLPVIMHEQVAGDRLTLTVLPKGGGAENKSRLRMLLPTAGWEGVRAFVVDTVRQAGGDACPPLVVGVGIGGSFDRAAHLAKRALFRPLTRRNPDRALAREEAELLRALNALGVGPLGFGGRTTALAVHILAEPCHIASLPVAVNINCHATRRATVTL